MTLLEEFRTWALAPERTNDELFTAELLVEEAEEKARNKRGDYSGNRGDEHWARLKRRKLNPAYRPDLRKRLDLPEERWAEVKRLTTGILDTDRPVRDLAALRFFPHLTQINVHSELASLAPLGELRELNDIHLTDPGLSDLDGIAGLPKLEHIYLYLHAPWPKLTALGSLPNLKVMHCTFNLLALADVPELPVAERVTLGSRFGLPWRDAREAPAMPRVTNLALELADLRGLERFAGVQTLELKGPFADLAPLTTMKKVTVLKLAGERFSDLQPLARMPRLRKLELVRERGIDVTPLADSPRLCLVEARQCPAIATELASLNAIIRIQDEEFVAPEPRALRPLRTFHYNPQRADYKSIERRPRLQEARAEFSEGDPVVGEAERAWFERQIQARLDALLGAGWGKPHSWAPGAATVNVRRFQDAIRFAEIVRTLRELFATMRFPGGVWLVFEPHGEIDDDLEEIEEREGGGNEQEKEARQLEQELEEWREHHQHWLEQKAFREREHRMKLREQEGLPIDPKEFAQPEPPPPEAEVVDEDAPAERSDPLPSAGREFGFSVNLEESFLWITERELENAREFLDAEPEDWHALPEPPEARPFPQ